MRSRLVPTLLLAGAALAAGPAVGAAAVAEVPTAGSTGGMALGPDGNLWVTLPFASKVQRISPAGAILNTYAVGSNPTSVAAGGGGRVWVTVTGADKVTWFDATAASPTAHDVSTVSGTTCGPSAIVSGGDGRMYMSFPDDGGCGGDKLGSIEDSGSGYVVGGESVGNVYDLAVAGGKLFAPDFGGDVVRRLSLASSPTIEAEIRVAAGSSPDGITVDAAGNLWVTEWSTGRLATFAATAANGSTATEITPQGGTLVNPFGIVADNAGQIQVAGKGSSNLALIDAATRVTTGFYALPQSEPFSLALGPNGATWITDQSQPRVLQFAKDQPVVQVPAPAAPATAPSAPAPTTPAPVVLATRTSFTSKRIGDATIVTKVAVKGLVGGETIKILCSGKSCPFKSKSFTKIKGRSATYDKKIFKDKRLASGTKVTVRVTKPDTVGNATVLTARKGKKGTITSGCLKPGSTKVTKC